MMEECLCNDTCIQKYKRPAVAVEFLHRGDSFFRNSHVQAPVVFTDSIVRLLMVILLEVDLPVAVQLFQRTNLLGLCLGQERVADLMEFFDFAL